MRFLVDEDLPRSTDDLLRRYSHEAVAVRNILASEGLKIPRLRLMLAVKVFVL
jgi:predicted nuclease of predicted toxin-antitoxin system